MPEPKYDTCMNCGAIVHNLRADKELHNEWHQKIDELIEWAQEVSKLFAPPAPDPEPQPSDGPDYHAEHAAWRRRNGETPSP